MSLNDRQKKKFLVFMNIAKQISSLSYDDKFKVGSVIITDDFREICSMGYNGNYKGGPNERDSLETGKSGFLHSEENALLHLSKPYELREKLVLICTHLPCPMCAKRIVNSGIKMVIFNEMYNALGNDTIKIFKESSVMCKNINEYFSDDPLQNDLH